MPKKTKDYDNVFKTMKIKHKRLFIPVINEIFGKHYPANTKIEILSSEGYLTEKETIDDSKKIEEQISDFLIKIGNDVYLLECQTYDDDSMTIRIAEYAFITARQFAKWDIGHATIPMPHFSVIYVKRTNKTPKKTVITFTFPNGEKVDYEADNVILDELTKEEILQKQLFAYIPFYIARYEKQIISTSNDDITFAINDLEYFRDGLKKLHQNGELTDVELIDMVGFVNTIIKHIADGNENEERLVNIMGGVVIETESEKLRRISREEGERLGRQEGEARGLILGTVATLRDLEYDDSKIKTIIIKKFNLNDEDAQKYL